MSAIASRYARALADVTMSTNADAPTMIAGLESLAALFKESAELRTLFDNPAVPAPQKIKLVDALAARTNISKPLRNFIAVLADKRRIGLLPDIAQQFAAEINERLGFAEADIASARELSSDERAQLEQQVSKAVGKKVRARYRKDATLLGGVVVKVGSTVFDGSVRGQLQRMKTALAQ